MSVIGDAYIRLCKFILIININTFYIVNEYLMIFLLRHLNFFKAIKHLRLECHNGFYHRLVTILHIMPINTANLW